MQIYYKSNEIKPITKHQHVVIESDTGKKIRIKNLEKLIPSNLTLTVVTLALNQGRFLCEWIELHKSMGFQFFIIFDDNSTDNTAMILHEYILSKQIILVHAKDSFWHCKQRNTDIKIHVQAQCQQTVFNFARYHLAQKTTWMGNFDCDEFLWTPRGTQSLTKLLQTAYLEYDKIEIISSVFGNNNTTDPEYTSVIEKFTKRSDSSPFLFIFYHGHKFGHKSLYRPEKMYYINIHEAMCSNCKSTTVYPLAQDIRMNHYQYKSRTEQRMKVFINGNNAIDENHVNEDLLNKVEDKDILYLAHHIFKCFLNS